MEYRGQYNVIGPPGCGKTTYISRQTSAIISSQSGLAKSINPNPVCLLSLTRTAAQEIVRKMGTDGVPISRECVGTLHGHAYRALGSPKVASGDVLSSWNEFEPTFALDVGGSVDDAVDDPRKTEGSEIIDERFAGGSPGEDAAERYHLLRHRMISRDTWPEQVTRFARRWEEWKEAEDVIDFTDMIDHCLEAVDEAPTGPQVVLADEAQDMSAMEYALFKKWGNAAGAMMCVGDPWQALYEWRGAHPGLFSDPDIPEDHRKTLKQSYRVPIAVKNAAIKWARRLTDFYDIDYEPREFDGEVGLTNATWKRPDVAIAEARKHIDEGRSVMICGACAFMMTPTVMTLRKHGIPFSNPWRTRRGDWNPLARRRGVSMSDRILSLLRPSEDVWGEDARPWTYRDISEWVDVLRASEVLTRGMKGRLASIVSERGDDLFRGLRDDPFSMSEEDLRMFSGDAPDRLMSMISTGKFREALTWFEEHLQASRAKSAQFPISVAKQSGPEALRQPPKLYVGTVHSFKGAEADVVIIYPDLSKAGFKEWGRSGETRNPVVRTFYVALTRARQMALIANPIGSLSVPLGEVATGV